jgi:hypothetical protein
MACHASGSPVKYREIGSCTFNRPRSCRSKMQADVNCLLSDAILNFVFRVLGVPHSSSPIPYAFSKTILPLIPTRTSPRKKWWAASALMYASSCSDSLVLSVWLKVLVAVIARTTHRLDARNAMCKRHGRKDISKL